MSTAGAEPRGLRAGGTNASPIATSPRTGASPGCQRSLAQPVSRSWPTTATAAETTNGPFDTRAAVAAGGKGSRDSLAELPADRSVGRRAQPARSAPPRPHPHQYSAVMDGPEPHPPSGPSARPRVNTLRFSHVLLAEDTRPSGRHRVRKGHRARRSCERSAPIAAGEASAKSASGQQESCHSCSQTAAPWNRLPSRLRSALRSAVLPRAGGQREAAPDRLPLTSHQGSSITGGQRTLPRGFSGTGGSSGAGSGAPS